uniref:Uncharacterized protein n=1 Tax=Anguilla anguilla TaxID=7936 RepID=A0A0E9SXU6_ANGAN
MLIKTYFKSCGDSGGIVVFYFYGLSISVKAKPPG